MLIGWSSNSNFSLLGTIRGLAQIISYEVSLVLLILCFIILLIRYNFLKFLNFQLKLRFFFLNILMRLILIVIFLAEIRRSPFDFTEGESELVSGFNVEYRRLRVSFIFLAEYVSILFMRIFYIIIFFIGTIIFYFIFFLKILCLLFFFI